MTSPPQLRTGPETSDGSAAVTAPADCRIERHRSAPGDWGWILAFVPAFPLVLLVLRVWYLGRQDLQTMLLVLQTASPLGLMSALLINLIGAAPAVILALRVLHLLLRISTDCTGHPSWLWRVGLRIPTWVTAVAILLALLSWELRFLPTWLMLSLVILGLEVRVREHHSPAALTVACTVLPIGASLAALAWFAPAIAQAFSSAGERTTAILLLTPLLAGPALTGPLPSSVARWMLPTFATALVLIAPLLFTSSYLKAPVLPRVAVVIAETDEPNSPTSVIRGDLVNVDDRYSTLLLADGRIEFLPGNAHVRAQVLCPEGPEPPTSSVSAHGWHIEQNVLSWAAPQPPQVAPDPRCRER
jgi:hypothetical protein